MIRSLAYVGFRSPRAREWTAFGPEVLGLELVDAGPDDEVRLRNDEATWRIAVHPGETDDLAYIGWDVGGPGELTSAAERLRAAGIEVHDDDELAEVRDVDSAIWFVDPAGFRHELVDGQRVEPGSFTPGRPGVEFVTGEGGLGHIALFVPDLDDATRFFVDLFGFRHSDDIDADVYVRFFHCNARHHTVAIAALPGMAGLHHLMLEVTDMDDVGRAYDLVDERGLPVAMTLGRHTNDRMTSFYVRTPSGFEIEYGTGGRLIDTGRPWTPGRFDAASTWGHKPAAEPPPPGILRPVTS